MNHRQRLTSITFTYKDDIQKYPLQLETVFLEFSRLCSSLTEIERTVTLLRTLPDSPMTITLLADVKNMEYGQMLSLVRSEIDFRKNRASSIILRRTEDKMDTKHPYPAAHKSFTRIRINRKRWMEKGVECWKCGRIGHVRAQCWKTHKQKHKENFCYRNHKQRGRQNRCTTNDASNRN